MRLLGRTGAVSLLVLVAFQFAYVDHWPVVQGALHASEHADSHVQHCHVGVSTCTDAPVSSGPGQVLASGEWLPSNPLFATPLFERGLNMPRSLVVLPQLPPPQPLS
jgi:hypothetical protein